MARRIKRDKIVILFIILDHLVENSPEVKTKLANVTGLNYAILEDFLFMLRNREFIETVYDGTNELVKITGKGRNIHSTLTIVLDELGILVNPKRSVFN